VTFIHGLPSDGSTFLHCTSRELTVFAFETIRAATSMVFRISMLIVMPTLTSVGTERMRVSSVVILSAKFCHCILAKSTDKHLADFIPSMVTLTSILLHDTIERWIIWGAQYAIQTEVVLCTAITVAMVDINLAPNSCETTRTRTMHSIFLLCIINCQVHFIVAVLISLYSQTTGPSVLTIQVAWWLHISFNIAQISCPAFWTDASFMPILRV
jgi:hypothetical protein